MKLINSALLALSLVGFSQAIVENAEIMDKPVVIGILTQPVSKLDQGNFPEAQYILEINREYVETSGMVKAIPIHYDMPADQLYALLDKIDGVHLTGGGLDLYNKTSGTWHPYYETARRIF